MALCFDGTVVVALCWVFLCFVLSVVVALSFSLLQVLSALEAMMTHWHDSMMSWVKRAGHFDKHNNIVFLQGAGIERGFVAHHMGDYNGRGIKMILDGGVSLVGNWIAYIQCQHPALCDSIR